jgi:hypothetical protein
MRKMAARQIPSAENTFSAGLPSVPPKQPVKVHKRAPRETIFRKKLMERLSSEWVYCTLCPLSVKMFWPAAPGYSDKQEPDIIDILIS